MFEERELLRTDPYLLHLLTLYAAAGAADREAWQDRVMALDGVEPRRLSRLHGEMIAYGWVEQNTGATPVLKAGIAAACYRLTPGGLKAVKWARTADDDADAA